ncbi:6698_t:CDS:2 [Entrophospora sp. SA101]|nr:6698_t:CDS:2 [Entrophospora sp. SA101]
MALNNNNDNVLSINNTHYNSLSNYNISTGNNNIINLNDNSGSNNYDSDNNASALIPTSSTSKSTIKPSYCSLN